MSAAFQIHLSPLKDIPDLGHDIGGHPSEDCSQQVEELDDLLVALDVAVHAESGAVLAVARVEVLEEVLHVKVGVVRG